MRSHCRSVGVRAATAVLALAAVWSAPATAGPALASQKNCLSCHQIDSKIIGPSYKDVAAKYAGQADAPARLVQKVMKGGSGVWGAVPMPANPQVSEGEAKQLVQWILSLKVNTAVSAATFEVRASAAPRRPE